MTDVTRAAGEQRRMDSVVVSSKGLPIDKATAVPMEALEVRASEGVASGSDAGLSLQAQSRE